LEEKAKALADQGKWALFIDILELLVFQVVLFPNVDGLVDLVAIDAFLAYHHSKESLIIAILADAMTHLTEDAKRAVQESSVAHLLFMDDWSLTSFIMKVDPSVPCKVTTHAPRKGRPIGSNSWLVWWGHPLIGSPDGRKEEPEFRPHARGSQTSP